MEFFIPAFRCNGKRHRARLRITGKWRFKQILDSFQQGTVRRLWVGFLLIIIMTDDQ